MRGSILVLSGPSGAGKSTLIKEMVKDIGPYYFSISTTTRTPREGEKDGVDYFFVDKESFQQDIAEELFLEYALVHGNYYGTSLRAVEEALGEGKLVIFDIDVQGHQSIKTRLPDITTSVFITPPSFEALKERLINRKTDSMEVIEKRLVMAGEELKQIDAFDYVIVNDDLDKAIKEIKAVALTSKLKKCPASLDALKTLWKGL
jgi:guanylate kinase